MSACFVRPLDRLRSASSLLAMMLIATAPLQWCPSLHAQQAATATAAAVTEATEAVDRERPTQAPERSPQTPNVAQPKPDAASEPDEESEPDESSEPPEPEIVDVATSLDPVKDFQSAAVRSQASDVAHWGHRPRRYTTWSQHSNRLIPVYTFGISLDALRERGSVYADRDRLATRYGYPPKGSLNLVAEYFDQTDLYELQQRAVEMGKTALIVMVFDGMDWQTTRAAAVYNDPNRARLGGRSVYRSGRGSGLSFLDHRGSVTDYGLVVTSAFGGGAKHDVDRQTVIDVRRDAAGGYDPNRGGAAAWDGDSRRNYLLGEDRSMPHQVTDSAASATSIFSGRKTFNGSINVSVDGEEIVPIARDLQQQQGWKIGLVTSVPVSHATPAAAYANNVTRKDYQDISRDLVGLPSSFHRDEPLPGVDVLIGGGVGEGKEADSLQGMNFATGNTYFHEDDLRKVDVNNGGNYVVAKRADGKSGKKTLMRAARRAADEEQRLIGFFGVRGGHLPFRTADGNFDPTFDIKGTERYSDADITENPTLADMTRAALTVLENSIEGFYLMIEAGDVDWANHSNNLDNSIGAVLSGAAAFDEVTQWVERNDAWEYTAVIVTADHGHYLVIDNDEKLAAAGQRALELTRETGNDASTSKAPPSASAGASADSRR